MTSGKWSSASARNKNGNRDRTPRTGSWKPPARTDASDGHGQTTRRNNALAEEKPADTNDSDDASRFVVGIDLGTTNCALCFVDTLEAEWQVETFRIGQWVDLGQLESRERKQTSGQAACTDYSK